MRHRSGSVRTPGAVVRADGYGFPPARRVALNRSISGGSSASVPIAAWAPAARNRSRTAVRRSSRSLLGSRRNSSSLSPISLLELGAYAKSDRLIVCCPDGYHRQGNVQYVCQKYKIPFFKDFDEFALVTKTKLQDILERKEKK